MRSLLGTGGASGVSHVVEKKKKKESNTSGGVSGGHQASVTTMKFPK
jgi:hypothetical protein